VEDTSKRKEDFTAAPKSLNSSSRYTHTHFYGLADNFKKERLLKAAWNTSPSLLWMTRGIKTSSSRYSHNPQYTSVYYCNPADVTTWIASV